MTLKVIVEEYLDTYDEDTVEAQKINFENEDVSFSFRVSNLCECPEDATISRDLFNATDFIDALNLGIWLARLGYDKVEGEYVTVDYD